MTERDEALKEALEVAEIVQKIADEMLSNGLSQKDFVCPRCSKSVIVQLDYCCGVVATCETPKCLYMHLNLGLNFEENKNGAH